MEYVINVQVVLAFVSFSWLHLFIDLSQEYDILLLWVIVVVPLSLDIIMEVSDAHW